MMKKGILFFTLLCFSGTIQTIHAQLTPKYKSWNFSFYGGYTGNLPHKKGYVGDSYGRGIDIQSIYRLSPQVSYMLNALQTGIQYELTTGCLNELTIKESSRNKPQRFVFGGLFLLKMFKNNTISTALKVNFK